MNKRLPWLYLRSLNVIDENCQLRKIMLSFLTFSSLSRDAVMCYEQCDRANKLIVQSWQLS
jgi:hypothetical protein